MIFVAWPLNIRPPSSRDQDHFKCKKSSTLKLNKQLSPKKVVIYSSYCSALTLNQLAIRALHCQMNYLVDLLEKIFLLSWTTPPLLPPSPTFLSSKVAKSFDPFVWSDLENSIQGKEGRKFIMEGEQRKLMWISDRSLSTQLKPPIIFLIFCPSIYWRVPDFIACNRNFLFIHL